MSASHMYTYGVGPDPNAVNVKIQASQTTFEQSCSSRITIMPYIIKDHEHSEVNTGRQHVT
jgi:hypothetical protein